MNPARKPGKDLDSLQHFTSCSTPPFDPLEDRENSLSPDIEDVGQSTTASNCSCQNKRVTTSKLKEDSNKTFSEVMTKMTSHVVNQYNGKEYQ